jgi:hypothetical protein
MFAVSDDTCSVFPAASVWLCLAMYPGRESLGDYKYTMAHHHKVWI